MSESKPPHPYRDPWARAERLSRKPSLGAEVNALATDVRFILTERGYDEMPRARVADLANKLEGINAALASGLAGLNGVTYAIIVTSGALIPMARQLPAPWGLGFQCLLIGLAGGSALGLAPVRVAEAAAVRLKEATADLGRYLATRPLTTVRIDIGATGEGLGSTPTDVASSSEAATLAARERSK